MKVKCFKKTHNFEKFRKEMRELIVKCAGEIKVSQGPLSEEMPREVTVKNIHQSIEETDHSNT